jgi:hypothetical protein
MLFVCLFAFSANLWIVKMEVAHYSETSVNFYHTTRCLIPEGSILLNLQFISFFKINILNVIYEYNSANYLWLFLFKSDQYYLIF